MMVFRVTEDLQWLRLDEYDNDTDLRQVEISLTREVRNSYIYKNSKNKKMARYAGWDGKVCFFHKRRFVPVGLWNELLKIDKEWNLDITIDGLDRLISNTPTLEEFKAWCDEYFKDAVRKPYDHQVVSAHRIITYRKSVQELATNAGKTLIVFMVVSYMKTHGMLKKFLRIVPNNNLVGQALEDFQAYGGYKLGLKFQLISGDSGEGKTPIRSEADIVIGTFQSLVRREDPAFADFNVVCVDEAHQTNAMSIKKILSRCTGSSYRFGLTGTLVGEGTADHFTIQSQLGPVVMKVSPDYLFGEGISTPLDIRIVRMNYLPEEAREKLYKLHQNKNSMEGSQLLNIEKKLARASRARLNFIVDTILKATKNSLVLFQDVDTNYGKQIYDLIREKDSSKEVFYVDGSTSDTLREEYKQRMKSGDNRILIATYLTFATGISIPNLHNIFLTESYKSEILIKQSLGRMMRLHDDKEVAIVFDFVDDFSYRGKLNYLMKHSNERLEIYIRENFKYKIYTVSLTAD